VGQLLSIVFFFALLVALAALLEHIFRANRAAIFAALRGAAAVPAAKAETKARPARALPGVHAAA
jgi:hypothetical protein